MPMHTRRCAVHALPCAANGRRLVRDTLRGHTPGTLLGFLAQIIVINRREFAQGPPRVHEKRKCARTTGSTIRDPNAALVV
jgi:hypothetical protein